MFGTMLSASSRSSLAVAKRAPAGWVAFEATSRPRQFGYYPGGKEGHIPTQSASEGSGAFPSLARRVNMQQHAELPCRGNMKRRSCGWSEDFMLETPTGATI